MSGVFGLSGFAFGEITSCPIDPGLVAFPGHCSRNSNQTLTPPLCAVVLPHSPDRSFPRLDRSHDPDDALRQAILPLLRIRDS